MPNADYEEWKTLIGDIVESPYFHRSKRERKLLEVLFDHQMDADPFEGDELSAEVYGGDADDQPEQPIRTLCLALRRKLWRYSGSDEGEAQKWSCQFPKAGVRLGYRLAFLNQWALPGLTGAFWQAHRPGGIDLFHSEPLFFRDLKGNAIYRYLDVNLDDGPRIQRAAMDELADIRPTIERKNLSPCFVYVATGEISARDGIVKWFRDYAGIDVAIRKGGDVADGSSPVSAVMIGRPQSNTRMKVLVESKRCESLSFRFDNSRFGTILVRDINKTERPRLDQLPGGNIQREGDSVNLIDSLESEGYAFGVVTRMADAYSRSGVVTMITSYNTFAISQIALTLTNEAALQNALGSRNWKAGISFPRCFQLLFKAQIGTTSPDSDTREPELIGFSSYDDSGRETRDSR